MVALFIAVLLMTLFIPLLSVFLIWFLAFPFIIFGRRYHLRANGVAGATALLLSFILTGLIGFIVALFFVASGVAIGEIYKRHQGGFPVLIGAGLTFTTALVLSFVASTLIAGVDPMTTIKESMLNQIDFIESTLGSLANEAVSEQMMQVAEFIVYLGPVILVTTAVAFAVITVGFSQLILRRLGLEVTKIPPFREWKFPRAFFWYYFIVLILSFFSFEEGTTMFLVVTNLFLILGFVMMVQGFSLIFYYFHVVHRTKVWPFIILIVCILFSPLLELVRILGIVDLGFEIRAWIDNKKKK